MLVTVSDHISILLVLQSFFNQASSNFMKAAFDSTNNKIVIGYTDVNNSQTTGTAIVGTVSGTSISFGTSAVLNQQQVFSILMLHLIQMLIKFVVLTNTQIIQDYGTAALGTGVRHKFKFW